MGMHLYGHIGTGDGTNPTADASGRFDQLGEEITLQVYFLRHFQNLHRTRLHTQFASFTVVLIYSYTGHESFPSVNKSF